ncbi:MAG: ABC transporter substrate-binding protein [Salinarimonadaceae bacterium]|nr:MAG: ABC transporter substrate-binding protein [Salinarimonadaceae bacterium]
MRRLTGIVAAALAATFMFVVPVAAADADRRHAIAMHGDPALPPDFQYFPYLNPDAPRGGRLTLALHGTFDSLNPFVVRGVAPDAAPKFVLESLLARSLDEAFSLYPLLAQSVIMPDDRSFITFEINPKARFSDGVPVTAEDVAFSFEMLLTKGKPFHRSNFAQVSAVETLGPRTIRFDLSGSQDRELPLLIGMMPIFAAHATDPERFEETSLNPPVGSGPYVFTEVRPGESLTLRRRTDYWGENLPTRRGLFNFDVVRYEFFRDANTMFEAFKTGAYDLRIEGDPTRWATGYDFPAINAGRIVREEIPISTPRGMNGFVFNTRRELFSDIRVREALSIAFDFEWANRNLFFDLLARTSSYFAGSELASVGVEAGEEELRLLAPFPDAVRADILAGEWRPAVSDGSGRDRALARRAISLLDDAGWTLAGGALRSKATGEPFSFELLVVSRQQERLALNFAQTLRRIGVEARVRLVDDVQFWRRLASFDFDMIQWTWPVSASPGNEQRNRWSSLAAEREGSLNYSGAREPAIDALIDALLAATDREDFVSAARALDRVLLSGFYVVPLYHQPALWIAHDAGLRRPERVPMMGLPPELWWRESS